MYLSIYMYLFMFLYSMNLVFKLWNVVLLTLIMMELVVMSCLLMLCLVMSKIMMVYLILYYLVMCVCESVLGLTLLMLMLRSHGSDNMKFINLILW